MARKFDIQYIKILAQRLQGVPAWRELAEACRNILGQEVDEKRRKLEKMRDSVQYRKGDTLVDVIYDPTLPDAAPGFYESDNAPLPLQANGMIIKEAKVERVHKNLTYLNHPKTTDYLELSFPYQHSPARWLMPLNNPQERQILDKNAFISGFEFFNNKINDEDLQRLYEFIQLYWDEAGASDQFLHFIGFIKNVRLEMFPLWSYDDNTDFFPILQPRDVNVKPAYEGGNWFLTSHVEIKYDLRQFNETYRVDMSDLEDLFYFFAPIILVLERISPTIDYPIDIRIDSVAQYTIVEMGQSVEQANYNFNIGSLLMRQDTICQYSVYREAE